MNQKLITATTRLKNRTAHLAIDRATILTHCREYLRTLKTRTPTEHTLTAIHRTEQLIAELRALNL